MVCPSPWRKVLLKRRVRGVTGVHCLFILLLPFSKAGAPVTYIGGPGRLSLGSQCPGGCTDTARMVTLGAVIRTLLVALGPGSHAPTGAV